MVTTYRVRLSYLEEGGTFINGPNNILPQYQLAGPKTNTESHQNNKSMRRIMNPTENSLDGTTTKVHAEQIRLAKLDWEIPNNNQSRALRKAAYVVPIESQSEGSSDDESIDSDTPLNQIAKRYKKERENSDEEDDIPLMELSKKLRGKKNFSEQDSQIENDDNDDQVIKEEVKNTPSYYEVSDIKDNMYSTHSSSVTSENYDIEDSMSVNSVKITNNQKPTDIGANETKLVSKEHVQNLVRALIGKASDEMVVVLTCSFWLNKPIHCQGKYHVPENQGNSNYKVKLAHYFCRRLGSF
ncbi:Hypothetical predicted protein [Mytilus galloprovincialis]|uniref:Uncharacterized protein n=1 Tax=Mytilus galloprovincialis TaxID=29158 RepID=A0A8B6EZE7_MYTGA|nr:Hypothetical predicted protein [Mytilus galloprovincialis]